MLGDCWRRRAARRDAQRKAVRLGAGEERHRARTADDAIIEIGICHRYPLRRIARQMVEHGAIHRLLEVDGERILAIVGMDRAQRQAMETDFQAIGTVGDHLLAIALCQSRHRRCQARDHRGQRRKPQYRRYRPLPARPVGHG